MFHSRGTVQSNTCVPVGTSWISRGIVLLTIFQGLAKTIASDASADRIERSMSSYIACPTSDSAGSLDLFRDSVWAIAQCIEQCQGVEKRLPSPGALDLPRFSRNSKSGKETQKQNNFAGESAILLAASRRAGPVELTLSAKTP
jgi:hypothetical protein